MRIKLSGLIYAGIWLVYCGLVLFLVTMNAETGLADNVTVDKSELLSAITSASAKVGSAVAGIEPGQYPQSAINVFGSAIAKAEAVADDTDATQIEVNKALADLEAAEKVFDASKIKTVNKSALISAINAASTKMENAVAGVEPGQYPQSAITAFNKAIEKAETVADDSSATQAEVNQAIKDLKAAEAIFDATKIAAVNKSALISAINAASTKVKNAVAGAEPGQYPQSAINAFKEAIDKAEAIAEDTGSSQAEINKALTDLKAAETVFDAAKIAAANKSALISAINAASTKVKNAVAGVELGQYPQSAITAFNKAIEKAEAVGDDSSATQAEVNQAIKDLKAAEAIFDAAKIIAVDHTPPSTITGLKESSIGSSWIRWTWVNPPDSDFSHVIVYLDGIFVTNTSKTFYNATGLVADTSHIITIETVDTSGNINPTLISDPATTAVARDTIPPASITGLQESDVGPNWVRWTWTNPKDADFAYVILYLNGVFIANTSETFYNFTGLAEGTAYIISTRTVDISGNINPIRVNDSATTASLTDAIPPASVTTLEEAEAGQNWITWTWVNPTDTDFSHVIVYLDGSFVTNTSNAFYVATELGSLYISDLDVEDEWVKVKNSGSSAVNLAGWQIKDEGNLHTYTFPSFELEAGTTVILYTAEGNNNETELYWGSDGFIWNNDGDTAYLYNSGGYLVDSLRSGTTHTIETTHVISTKTVDTSGNINPIWVNDSATTSSTSSGGGGSGGGSTSGKSSSSGGGGGGGAGSVEDFTNVATKDADNEYLRMNSNVTYEFTRAGNDIQSVSFYSLKNSGDTTSTIEVLNNRSKLVNVNPEGLVYRYINIWVGKAGFAIPDNIRNARIKFRVNNSWIEEMGVSSADIKLQRYDGTSWQVLPTSIESDTANYVVFEAQTPGFSPFAITAEHLFTSPQDSDDVVALSSNTADVGLEKTKPGKSVIWTLIIAFVLMGVLAVGYEYLKKE